MVPIVLVGFMGAGKSTVGRLVAARLGRSFVDSDDVITERTGRTPRDIFATDGEAVFRRHERDVIVGLVDGDARAQRVIAIGGGAVQDPRTRALLRQALVVHLDVSYDEALARVGGDPDRPVLARPDLYELYELRTFCYRELADVAVATDGLAPEVVAEQVVAAVGVAAGGASSRHLLE